MGNWNRDLRESSTWELLRRCCSLSMAAHQSPDAPFLLDWFPSSFSSPPPSPAYAIFAFPGSWSAADWLSEQVSDDPFGSCEVDGDLFPSLMTVFRSVPAVVHAGFLRCFRRILQDSALRAEASILFSCFASVHQVKLRPFPGKVDRALNCKRQIVFTGHSSGGAISALAAIWLLDSLKLHDSQDFPLCVTFGSPLVGNDVFTNSLLREGWSCYFLNFVMNFDIVPRILLAPFRSIKKDLQAILHLLFSKWSCFSLSFVENSQLATFFATILKNSQDITTKRACMLMRCTNPLLQTFTSFTQLSPYRPFGAYVFCTMGGSLLMVTNSEAVLQLLFHFLQMDYEQKVEEVADRSLNEHLLYEAEVQKSFKIPDIVHLDNLQAVPLSLRNAFSKEMQLLGILFRDLGLSADARLRLCAIGEQENQRERNQVTVDETRSKIEDAMKFLKEYQEKCKNRGLGYYDTFKLQKHYDDFDANVKRIELAGLWDQIVEMLKRCELPGKFESRKEWVELGTSYRRLVEPLDIANYYRHAKNEDTGPYLLKGRPSRYTYTQSWLEYIHRMDMGSCPDSCFWANVEELCIDTNNGKLYFELKDRITELEKQAEAWHSQGLLSGDVFLGESTFLKWWKTLPQEHRSKSHIRRYIDAKVLKRLDVPPFDDARKGASVGVRSGELPVETPVKGPYG
ncbi:hypothetical protein Taro_026958 [Colocasia esculenta]|uniref:Uncharacterized protein n=1 Tax=Colocasia esculenta TaxID=4460 RepID=A0A843VM77_COLES|nr:hypothetical protein [Colocasia esculenta]